MSKKYYSVRESSINKNLYKVVLVGGWFGYEDLDLPYYNTFEEAAKVAERLNKF